VGRLVVALFLGFFGLLAAGAAGVQLYGFTGLHARRRRQRGRAGSEEASS
jgi:hypothetical protein